MAFLKVLFYLVVLILVLVLAYYTTRILGRGMRLKQRTGGMEVLDQMTVGRDSFLVVVKVQEKIQPSCYCQQTALYCKCL